MTELVLRRLGPWLDNKQVLLVALGLLVLLAAVFPPACLGVLMILWLRRPEITEGFGRILAPERRWYLFLPALIVIGFAFAKSGAMPHDDLFRHLTSYLHDYDYSHYYLYSDPRTPHASMWIGFEWLAGHVHRTLGLFWAAQFMEAVGLVWALALFTTLFLRLMADHPERTLLTAVGVAAVLYSGLLSRIESARPEIFLALLALTALLCNTRTKALLWWLAMLAAQPLYWLAIIYAPSALLLPKLSWTQRVLLALGIVVTGVVFWNLYAGPEWFGFFQLLREWFGNRAFNVSENNPIYQMLFIPGALILVLVALMFSEQRDFKANLPVLLVLAWFLLPNQLRYASVIAPLIAVLAARGMNAHPFRMSAAQRFIAVAAIVGILIGRMQGGGSYDSLPTFTTLDGKARVLTLFDPATFYLPAQTPGLQVAPSLEAGATERGVQTLLLSILRQRRVDCAQLAAYPEFTHVVDKNIEQVPPCLELVELHRDWRLWKIKPAVANPRDASAP